MQKAIRMILALVVLVIGIFMVWTWRDKFPAPPLLSGIAFIAIGLSLWMPNCPIMNYFFPKKK